MKKRFMTVKCENLIFCLLNFCYYFIRPMRIGNRMGRSHLKLGDRAL
nr:MAG TPA: hypothetical protein [Caudoviricetes sp.]